MNLLSTGFTVLSFVAAVSMSACGKTIKQRSTLAHQSPVPRDADLVRLEPEKPPVAEPTPTTTEPDKKKQCAEEGGQWLGDRCLTEEALPHCSDKYVIPATANPYLAGQPAGTTLTYETGGPAPRDKSIDSAPQQSPVQIIPMHAHCLKAGTKLYFDVSGTISHGSNTIKTNADGRQDIASPSHALGSLLGKSNIKAPLNSLVGVFLRGSNPSGALPPAMLEFGNPEQRNRISLSPEVGQVFFIGDGKTDDGVLQHVIIPAGTERLFIGIMDAYEWNNNVGELAIAIKSEVP